MKTSEQLLDMYYLDARCMLIEVAAILDRVDRAKVDGDAVANSNGAENSSADPRLEQLYDTLAFLSKPDPEANRSEHILNLFSELD